MIQNFWDDSIFHGNFSDILNSMLKIEPANRLLFPRDD